MRFFATNAPGPIFSRWLASGESRGFVLSSIELARATGNLVRRLRRHQQPAAPVDEYGASAGAHAMGEKPNANDNVESARERGCSARTSSWRSTEKEILLHWQRDEGA